MKDHKKRWKKFQQKVKKGKKVKIDNRELKTVQNRLNKLTGKKTLKNGDITLWLKNINVVLINAIKE